MKRTASILLLGILLFNWVGFRFLSSYLEQKANQQLESSLDDNNFDESQLVSIKVPSGHISSYANYSRFERVDGQIEIQGVPYKYVKIRHFNDSLELLCIPNRQVTQLRNAKDDFFKLVNDLQHTGQSKKSDNHSGSSKNFSVDYYTLHDGFSLGPISIALVPVHGRYLESHSASYFPTAEQPPENC